MSETRCPICGGEAIFGRLEDFFGGYVNCEKCGIICFERSAENFFNSKEGYILRSCLFYFLIHKNIKNGKPYLIVSGEKKANDKYNVLNIQELLNLYPKNITQRIDMILQNMASIEPHIGSDFVIPVDEGKYEHILFLDKSGAASDRYGILKMMCDQKLIIDVSPTQPRSFFKDLRIDYKGWERLDQNQLKSKTKIQGFIAMWFNQELNDIRNAITEAISETGYFPRILDEKEYNGQIVPEIFYEIENSEFIIADLTGNRGGVYYEAGYARALGKELIITVMDIGKKESEMDNEEQIKHIPHFDVAQWNQIKYKDANDLKTKLVKRITATVGDISKEN